MLKNKTSKQILFEIEQLETKINESHSKNEKSRLKEELDFLNKTIYEQMEKDKKNKIILNSNNPLNYEFGMN